MLAAKSGNYVFFVMLPQTNRSQIMLVIYGLDQTRVISWYYMQRSKTARRS